MQAAHISAIPAAEPEAMAGHRKDTVPKARAEKICKAELRAAACHYCFQYSVQLF